MERNRDEGTKMKRYQVVLLSPTGTTDDVIVAGSEYEAVQVALRLWKRATGRTHREFFSAPALDSDNRPASN